MNKPVRIAMLGSGFVADFYMQGLADVNGQEVIVNYSRSLERASAFSLRWKIPEHSADLPAVIARSDLDLFIIALPNEEHLKTTLALAQAERNQVCTKPLGRSREEAREIFAAAHASAQSTAMPKRKCSRLASSKPVKRLR